MSRDRALGSVLVTLANVIARSEALALHLVHALMVDTPEGYAETLNDARRRVARLSREQLLNELGKELAESA